jgi:SAM-dependent methyltransferase
MILNRLKWRAGQAISFVALRLNPSRERFTCPICTYRGIFLNIEHETGDRQHARCPRCGAMERHRLQWLVVEELRKEIDFTKLRVLHMAPEKFIRTRLRARCATYLCADLHEKGVDRREDLTSLTFPDQSFDLVYCSHVLEHIKDDMAAIREIRRVLAPGGIAILPVPFISDFTVEYAEPNWHEQGHVRAPGLDYIDKYKACFGNVRVFSSGDFNRRYQIYTYEDRSRWPTRNLPNRRPSPGIKHPDYVPVCRV